MTCELHPEIDDGLRRCDGCGGAFCVACIAAADGRALCPACRESALAPEHERAVEEVAPPLPAGGDPELPHWERRSQLGVVRAFLATCREVCLETPRFTRRLDVPSRWSDAVVFGLLLALLAGVAEFVWSMLWNTVVLGVMSGARGNGPPPARMLGFQAAASALGVAVVPLVYAVGALVMPALTHLGLGVLKVRAAPFSQTVRLYCYTRAPLVLVVVPFLGGMVAGVWSFVAYVIGVRHLHRTTGWKAFLAAAWWILLLIALAIAVAIVIFVAFIVRQR